MVEASKYLNIKRNHAENNKCPSAAIALLNEFNLVFSYVQIEVPPTVTSGEKTEACIAFSQRLID